MAFNIHTAEGTTALDHKVEELFVRISAWPSAAIWRYLKDHGWKDCGWSGTYHLWDLPETRLPDQKTHRRVPQSRAIRYQIYFDIEDQGLIVRSFPLTNEKI